MSDKIVKLTLLYAVIVLLNLVTSTSFLSIYLTFAELAFVIYQLLRGRIRDSFFWHTVFTITCISATNAAGLEFDNSVMFSYSRLKIFGPIGLSYSVSIIIFIVSVFRKNIIPEGIMFRKLLWLLFFLLIDGVVIGAYGVLFSDYYTDYFLYFSVYSVMLVINCTCFVKLYDEKLMKKVYDSAAPLLIGSCIACVFAYYVLGISTTYGGLSNIILVPDLTYYGIILVFLPFLTKEKSLTIVGLICYLIIMINGVNGKQIVVTVLGLLFFMYFVFFTKHTSYSRKINFRKMIIPFLLLVIALPIILSYINVSFLAETKLGDTLSLFSDWNNLSEMSTSPYVRIASLLNILNDGVHSPINLLFGQGYGGYFTDSLNLLYSKINMYGTAGFPIEAAMKHKLPTGHDTFVVVPLLNGLVGLSALLTVVFNYTKKISRSPFSLAAIFWLLLVFYFNTQLAITGMFFLYAAEYDYYLFSKHQLLRKSV